MAHDEDSGVLTRERISVKKPPLYVVIMHNDDYTTMDFVIHVLMDVFQKQKADANNIMLDVHKKGAGICGVFPREIAETKIEIAHEKARDAGFPLKCSMRQE